jgi:DNA-binding NtrC family response regulator
MPEVIKLMILDDEKDYRDTLARAFSENRDYQFDVEVADSPQTCIRKGIDTKHFDVYLVDLEVIRGVRPFFGNSFIAIRTHEVPHSLCVVYSRYDQLENVVKAIREGAADFIVKNKECPPHKVPERIVKLLDERRRQAEEDEKLADLIAANREAWQKQYAGHVIVVVNGAVVHSDSTRLRAIVAYQESRIDHAEWPELPVLLEVSEAGEVPA